MLYVIIFCGVLLFVSALLVIVRVAKGPTVLDRTGALDVVTSIMIGALALLAAVTRRSDLLAVFVVVAVIGFLGSVAVARMTRMKPREEIADVIFTSQTDQVGNEDSDTDDSEGIHDPDIEENEIEEVNRG